MRRLMIPVLALMAVSGAASAQTCERVGGETRPGVRQASRYEADIQGGFVRSITLGFDNGRNSRTEFSPLRDGISVRLTTFPNRDDATRQTAVFNRVVMESADTLSVETWVRPPGQENAAPLYNWYRLRCAGGGGTTK